MFWNRNAPTPPTGSSSSAEADVDADFAQDGPRLRDLDAAIDAFIGLLKAFGEHAFDTDNVSAEDARGECDGWARKISMGEQVGIGPIKRDFGGARRYFVAARRKASCKSLRT